MSDEKEEAMTELVRRSSEKVIAELKPKEESYTAESFLKHQEMCNSPDCPVCSVMNDKVKNEKVKNTLDKIETTIDSISEKKKFNESSLGQKRKDCVRKCKSQFPNRFTRLKQAIRGT